MFSTARGSGKNLTIEYLTRQIEQSAMRAKDLPAMLEQFEFGESVQSIKNALVETSSQKISQKSCTRHANMTKKDLRHYDSCPDCGKSLYAMKSRGY